MQTPSRKRGQDVLSSCYSRLPVTPLLARHWRHSRDFPSLAMIGVSLTALVMAQLCWHQLCLHQLSVGAWNQAASPHLLRSPCAPWPSHPHHPCSNTHINSIPTLPIPAVSRTAIRSKPCNNSRIVDISGRPSTGRQCLPAMQSGVAAECTG
eukprot:356505-Chlamydomonas_euryale.AAC.1